MSTARQTATREKVLDISNLSVDYVSASGVVHAVSDVSLTLHRGEILGLAGESGSGKSTLAYAVARLLRPPAEVTGGTITYLAPSDESKKASVVQPGESVDVLDLDDEDLRALRWNELAIVFQSAMNALNPVLTIGTQIDDVLRAHGYGRDRRAREERAAELMRLVGIAPDRLRSFAHELSGGMRQRALIAMALALDPALLIMDEPTTALDVVTQRQILSELMALRDQLTFSMLIITHDLSLLVEISDVIAIMYAGKLVETGSSADIFYHPRHPYTYRLLHSFPPLHGPRRELSGIPGSPPDLRRVPSGCAFHPRCASAFEACKHIVPAMYTPAPAIPDQQSACLLWDASLNPSGPPPELRGEDPRGDDPRGDDRGRD